MAILNFSTTVAVTLPQVFLPYMLTNTGETVYERFEQQGLPAITDKPAV